MGRWTQYEEDAARLPEGMKRIAYDDVTQRYTFRDRDGTLYQSEPGSAYGRLTKVPTGTAMQNARPQAFEPSDPGKRRGTITGNSNLSSFQQFLPSEAITSPPPAEAPSTSSSIKRRATMFVPSSGSGSTIGNSSSRLQSMLHKVKTMKSGTSAMENRHSRSPSSPSAFTLASSSHPSRPRGNYKRIARSSEEDTRHLLRSESVSSRLSVDSASVRSPAGNRDPSSRVRPASAHSQSYDARRESWGSSASTVTPLRTA